MKKKSEVKYVWTTDAVVKSEQIESDVFLTLKSVGISPNEEQLDTLVKMVKGYIEKTIESFNW